jgi:hypothetical protein
MSTGRLVLDQYDVGIKEALLLANRTTWGITDRQKTFVC